MKNSKKNLVTKSENFIKKEILVWLSVQGFLPWNNVTGRFRSMHSDGIVNVGVPGAPDIVCVMPGSIFLGIETKTLKGKQRESQINFQKRIEEMGGYYCVARSIDDVRNFLTSKGIELSN